MNRIFTAEEEATVFRDPLSRTFPDPEHSEGEDRYLDIGHSERGRLLIGATPSGRAGYASLVHAPLPAKNGTVMKKDKYLVFEADKPILDAGDMRPEYDFSQLKPVGERGRHAKAMRNGYTTIMNHPDGTKEVTHYRPLPGSVVLDQDVRAYFPSSDAVNAALRGLIALIPARRRAARKARQQAKTDSTQ